MHAGILDMFQHASYNCCFPVGYCIYVKLYRIFKKLIQQNRLAGGGFKCFAHDFFHVFHAVDNEHSPASQDERRSKKNRKSYLAGKLVGVLRSCSCSIERLAQMQLVQNALKYFAVFGCVDRFRGSSYYVYAVFLQFTG